MSDHEKQWYSNKDLFEQIFALQIEMRDTRSIIKRYNGLYEKVHEVSEQVNRIERTEQGKNKVLNSIRQWGGWIFGLVTLIVLLYTTFI